jgi:hypothetical protein
MNDKQKLEKKLEQAKRLFVLAGDYITRQRLLEFRDELIEVLASFPHRRQYIGDHVIRERARDLWEQHGCPAGRDDEFWLRAERELVEASSNH